MEFLAAITYWHWLIFGIVLIALEIFVPGAFFLWVGLAAIAVGGLAAIFPIPVLGNFLLFAVLAIVFTVIGKRIFKAAIGAPQQSHLNRRAEQYIGQHITLSQAIVNNQGRAVIGDTIWRVVGPDLPKGTVVEVVGVEGNALVVRCISI
jgi:inner membrane protein